MANDRLRAKVAAEPTWNPKVDNAELLVLDEREQAAATAGREPLWERAVEAKPRARSGKIF